MVTIATYHSQAQAEAVRIFLAFEGIDAELWNEHVVAMDWSLTNAIGGIKLNVDPQDAERATTLIQAFEAKQRARREGLATKVVRFTCSECSEPQQFTGDRQGTVEICTECGNMIDVPEVADDQLVEQIPDCPRNDTTNFVRSKVSLRAEIICVLAFVYIPLLVPSLFFRHQVGQNDFIWEMTYLLLHMFSVVPPLLFIIAVNNEAWSKFGISKPRWITDALFAVGIWLISSIAASLTLGVLTHTDPFAGNGDQAAQQDVVAEPIGTEGRLSWEWILLCFVGLTANSVVEELTMRGYLIPRFEELFRSRAIAVCLSGAIFASYHIYQGLENVAAVFALAIVYGVSFCWLRRLFPLVVAHTIHNMVIYLNQ